MKPDKTTFALYFGNRGFFPASFLAEARDEMSRSLEKLGHRFLMMDASVTRYGAVETPEEGRKYARWLADHCGEYGGVILCLPNFGDETGAVVALRECGVPILIQAYPDELTRMAPDRRRDAFCGKLSIMDVFCQYGLNFTALPPHVVKPSSKAFAENIDYFDRVCRVVGGMRNLAVGAVGARTTAFKTVRIDEVALQRHGITVETIDLSDVFARMKAVRMTSAAAKAKVERLKGYTSWAGVPEEAFEKIVKLGVAIDQVIDEFALQAIGLRCWTEIQRQLNISPCVLVSELNERGVPCACEVDVGNAITMAAMRMATGDVTTCLDWNNNYGHAPEKCILFHCGAVPRSMMTGKGRISDHLILANAVGENKGFGCLVGRIRPMAFTFGSLLTRDGKLRFYLGHGRFTRDRIPPDFFGCAGVAHVKNLERVLQTIGYAGHRHHTSVVPGQVAEPMQEAFERYLGCEVTRVG